MQHKIFMLCIAFLSIAHKFCFHLESEYRTTSDATCKIVMLAEKTCLLKPAITRLTSKYDNAECYPRVLYIMYVG